MKIIATLADVCRPEDWVILHPAYVTVPIRYGMTHQELTEAIANAEIKGKDLLALAANQQQILTEAIANAEIKGKDLLALAANQQQMPGVLPIWEAEYLDLPHTVFQGFALLDDNAKEAWLGLAEKIRKAMKDVEVENLHLTTEDEGMNAYYLLEFDLCGS